MCGFFVQALEPQAVDELMEASEEDQGEGQEKDDGSEDMHSTEDESDASETTEVWEICNQPLSWFPFPIATRLISIPHADSVP